MAEVTQPGPVSEGACVREAVCIHTKKILDSCRDKDCIEDLRVYLTRDSQTCLDRATSVKARSAELLYVYIDVESAPFNNCYYTVDLTFYYKILADAIVGATRPTTVYGLAVFSKRVVLYGNEGSAKIFSSCYSPDGPDKQLMNQCNKPQAVVEVVDPILLAARLVEPGCGRKHDCCDAADLPECICQCFDDSLVTGGDSRRLLVTLGQFSIIRLERDTQILIPVYDYCLPTKECCVSGTGGSQDEDPCALFGKLQFPVNEFFPTCTGGVNPCAPTCTCGSTGGSTTTTTTTTTGCKTCK